MLEASFDLETCLIRLGLCCPPPVCLQMCVPEVSKVPALTDSLGLLVKAREALNSKTLRLWGTNIAFDMGVLMEAYPELTSLIKLAYEEGRIFEHGAIEKLGFIGNRSNLMRYNHGMMCAAYGIEVGDKEGSARTTFGQYLGKPLGDYSADHKRYMELDATSGGSLAVRQLKRFKGHVHNDDVAELSRRMFWLKRTSDYGIRTDPEYIRVLEVAAKVRVTDLRKHAQTPFPCTDEEERRIEQSADPGEDLELDDLRMVKLKTSKRKSGAWEPMKNTEFLRKLVSAAYDGRPPMTSQAKDFDKKNQARVKAGKPARVFKPQVQTGKSILEQSGEPMLEAMADYGTWSAVASKDLPMLRAGIEMPIHAYFGTANTFRTTCSRPNLQNFRANTLEITPDIFEALQESNCVPWGADPKEYRSLDIRNAVVPRQGNCIIGADYKGLETVTLAQLCINLGIGRHLAGLLNSGVSLHDVVGAQIHGISIEEAQRLKSIGDSAYCHGSRQAAKITNFGAPVGMGAASLKRNAKIAHNVDMTLAQARSYLKAWATAVPDGKGYLEYCSRLPKSYGGGLTVRIPGTRIIRRGATFCAAANTGFQGFAAALTSKVGWAIYWATLDPSSDLYGCRLINFVHDEFILECPIGQQGRAVRELKRIMIVVGQVFVPDVTLGADGFASNRWAKDACEEYDSAGELVIQQFELRQAA